MKAQVPCLRFLLIALLLGANPFAAKAQCHPLEWKADKQYTNTFRAMSHGNTALHFVHSQAADAEAVYHCDKLGLAFVIALDGDEAGDWKTYLESAVIESGHVHFMPSHKGSMSAGDVGMGVGYSYCDYQGRIGNEQFGMRQYLYLDESSTYLLRIVYKQEVSKEALMAAAEVQLLQTLDSLASSR